MKERLQRHIQEGVRVGISYDIWTILNGAAYLGIIVHQIDKEWVIYTRLLGFVVIPPSYTGYHIYKAFSKIIKTFGIQHHIISITIDSADSNRLSYDLFD